MQIEKRNMKVTLTDEEKQICDKASGLLLDILYNMDDNGTWNGYNTADIDEWVSMFEEASTSGIIEIE